MKNKDKVLSLALAACMICLFSAGSFSQNPDVDMKSIKVPTDTSHSFVKLHKITKYYTKEELNKLPKLALIDIYKARLTYLIEILPFLSLHPEPGATFHEMSIPETEVNIAHLDKEAKNKQTFVKSLSETLDDV